jgi:hypothetical protein
MGSLPGGVGPPLNHLRCFPSPSFGVPCCVDRSLPCLHLFFLYIFSLSAPAVYAALVAVVNTKFPELGELLLHRVVTQVGAGALEGSWLLYGAPLACAAPQSAAS